MSFDAVTYAEVAKSGKAILADTAAIKGFTDALESDTSAMRADLATVKTDIASLKSSPTDTNIVGSIIMAATAPSAKYIGLESDQWLSKLTYPDTAILRDQGGVYHQAYTAALATLSLSNGSAMSSPSAQVVAVKPDDSIIASVNTHTTLTNGRTYVSLYASINYGTTFSVGGQCGFDVNYSVQPYGGFYSATAQRWFVLALNSATNAIGHMYSSDSGVNALTVVPSGVVAYPSATGLVFREFNGKAYAHTSNQAIILSIDTTAPSVAMTACATTGIPTSALSDIAYGNGVWVVVGTNGVVCRKVGGATPAGAYTPITTPASLVAKIVTAVVFHGGKFYMVGAVAGSVFQSSDDGQTWTEQTGLFQGLGKQIISYSGILYILACDTTVKANIATSPDGVLWKNSEITASTANTTRKTMAISDNYLYVADFTSSDGKLWLMPINKKTSDWVYLAKTTSNGAAKFFMKVAK